MSGETGTPEWARSRVRREIDRLARKVGIEPRAIQVKGKEGPAQPRVEVSMPWHAYAGYEDSTGEYALQPGPTATRHVRRIAREKLTHHIRLLARDRQLEAAGHPPLVKPGTTRHVTIEERIANPLPAWAYEMSPVALAWMIAEGRDPDWIVSHGLTNTKNYRLHSQENGFDFEVHGARVRRFVLTIGNGARWRDDLHRPEVVTAGVQLPETVRMGLRHHRGKPLATVLSHPLLDTLPLVMAGLGRFGLAVERLPDVTLEPVPEHLGQPWNTIEID